MRKVTVKKPDQRRKIKVRARIKDSGRGRRLSVFRSNCYIYAQIIDLYLGKTLIGLSDKDLIAKDKKIAKLKKVDRAFELGKQIAKKAKIKKIRTVVFDRSSYKYHGRVKALAEGAREGGLKF